MAETSIKKVTILYGFYLHWTCIVNVISFYVAVNFHQQKLTILDIRYPVLLCT